MTEENYKLVKCLAGLPRTVRGRPIVIKADPKGKNLLYCNGNSVFIRNIEDPTETDIYTQHSKDTTCAAYSPSGFYICSADISGKIRIWDTVNKEHILKYEYPVMAGPVKDIAWTEDSKRIAVCGQGRESYAAAIMWDTGTSVGSLVGMSKPCNSIDIKQTRPYRLICASEDFTSVFYEGPPFKRMSNATDHGNFVNVCRFSPDGSKYATAGADGRCFVYDGKTGEKLGEMCEAAGKIHQGGIYGLAWSPDGKQLMSCSADKTVKIWNMDEKNYISNKEVAVFNMGKNLEDMQVSCAWIGDHIISVSLSGYINYLDIDNPTTPKRVIKGHNKSIVTSCMSEGRSILFTGSFDGLIYHWDLGTGLGIPIEGKSHTNQVQKMSCSGDIINTCGMDDTIRFISVQEKKYLDETLKMESQPQGIAAGGMGLTVVACLSHLVVIQDRKITHSYKAKCELTCVAICTALGKVVVGTNEANVLVYDIEGDSLKESGSFPTNGNATDILFSPNHAYVAVCTNKKQVKVVETSDFKTDKCNWGSHAVKVNSIGWTPDSQHLASCGIDGVVFTWDIANGARHAQIRGAHSQSVDVTSVQWSDNNTLITTGRQDCSMKIWQITR